MGIVSPECRLKIMRVGPFIEDDYIELCKFRDMLRKKRLDHVKEVLRRGRIGRFIKINLSLV